MSLRLRGVLLMMMILLSHVPGKVHGLTPGQWVLLDACNPQDLDHPLYPVIQCTDGETTLRMGFKEFEKYVYITKYEYKQCNA